jgi:hypothetical protein
MRLTGSTGRELIDGRRAKAEDYHDS